jgi:hypothetical protein
VCEAGFPGPQETFGAKSIIDRVVEIRGTEPSDVYVERVTPDGNPGPQETFGAKSITDRVVEIRGTDPAGVSSSRVTRKVRSEVRVRSGGTHAKLIRDLVGGTAALVLGLPARLVLDRVMLILDLVGGTAALVLGLPARLVLDHVVGTAARILHVVNPVTRIPNDNHESIQSPNKSALLHPRV